MSGVLSDESDDEGTQYSDKGVVYLQGFMKKRAQGVWRSCMVTIVDVFQISLFVFG